MATIEKTGIYRDANGDHFQLRAGQDVPEAYASTLTLTEPWPSPGQSLGSKADTAAETKKAAAPENKSA